MSRLSLLVVIHIFVYSLVLIAFGLPSRGWIVFAAILSIVLVWISCVDFVRFEIPDSASLLLFVSGMVLQAQFGWQHFGIHLFAAIFWATLLFAIAKIYVQLRGSEGLGFGDVKMIAGVAIWVGFAGTSIVVLLAALGAICSILGSAILRRAAMSQVLQSGIAFGPFLCIGTWAVWLNGTPL